MDSLIQHASLQENLKVIMWPPGLESFLESDQRPWKLDKGIILTVQEETPTVRLKTSGPFWSPPLFPWANRYCKME